MAVKPAAYGSHCQKLAVRRALWYVFSPQTLLAVTKNIGKSDRLIRFFAAIVVLGLLFSLPVSDDIAAVMLVVGTFLLLTSFMSLCPLYIMFGLNTSRRA